MNRFYVYKCVVDDGGAPCVDDGLFSLCICKPMIRSTARLGDWIFAFGSNYEKPANRLVYIAEVTQKLINGEYYDRDEFQNRGDCIYERTASDQFRVRKGAKFHGTQPGLVHDLGDAPNYQRANCLVSRDFRYFGANGTADWKVRALQLARLIELLDQGHRVNHTETLRAELLALKKSVWKKYTKKVNGKPLHPPARDTRGDDLPVVKVCSKRCYHVTTSCST